MELSSTPEFLALTPKQLAFVFAYLKSGNATQSYVDAYGVSVAVAENTGPRLLGNARVRAALEKAKIATGKKLEKKFSISRTAILKVLARQMLFDPSDLVEVEDGHARLKKPKSLKAIKSFSYSESSSAEGSSTSFSFSVHDKVKAAEVLAKMTGALDADDDGDDARRVSTLNGRAAELARRRRAKQ